MKILSGSELDLVTGGTEYYPNEFSEENPNQLRRPIGYIPPIVIPGSGFPSNPASPPLPPPPSPHI